MEATIARCPSGLDPVDLLGGDQEAVHDFISTFFAHDEETFSGNHSIPTAHSV